MNLEKFYVKGFTQAYPYTVVTKDPAKLGDDFIVLITNMRSTKILKVKKASKLVIEGANYWRIVTDTGTVHVLEEEKAEIPRVLTYVEVYEYLDEHSYAKKSVGPISEEIVRYVSEKLESGEGAFTVEGVPENKTPRLSRVTAFDKVVTSDIKKMWMEDNENGTQFFAKTVSGSFYSLFPNP